MRVNALLVLTIALLVDTGTTQAQTKFADYVGSWTGTKYPKTVGSISLTIQKNGDYTANYVEVIGARMKTSVAFGKVSRRGKAFILSLEKRPWQLVLSKDKETLTMVDFGNRSIKIVFEKGKEK